VRSTNVPSDIAFLELDESEREMLKNKTRELLVRSGKWKLLGIFLLSFFIFQQIWIFPRCSDIQATSGFRDMRGNDCQNVHVSNPRDLDNYRSKV
jgi:hypothetical protein